MSYFPIKIRITERNHKDCGKEMVVDHNQIPTGIAFVVLETNAEETKNDF